MNVWQRALRIVVLMLAVVASVEMAVWLWGRLFESAVYAPGEFEVTLAHGDTLVVYEEVLLLNVRSDYPFEFVSEEKPFDAQTIVPEIVLPPGRYYLQYGNDVKAQVVTTGNLEVVVVPGDPLEGVGYLVFAIVMVFICVGVGGWAFR